MKFPNSGRLLSVVVRSRQGVVYEGELYALTSFNNKGAFDILPEHTNFVTMVSNKVVLHKTDGRDDEINVDNGVLLVENNQVKVFLGISKV